MMKVNFTRPSPAYWDGVEYPEDVPVFDGGLQVYEGTTNLHNKTPGKDGTVNDIEIPGKTWAREIIAEADGNSFTGTISVPCQPGDVVTFSADIRRRVGEPRVRLYIGGDVSGNQSIALEDITISSDWNRYSVTGVVPDGDTSIVRATVQLYKPGQYTEIEVADWQLEKNPYATPFTVGTRANERATLTLPEPLPQEFGIGVTVRPSWGKDDPEGEGVYRRVFEASLPGSPRNSIGIIWAYTLKNWGAEVYIDGATAGTTVRLPVIDFAAGDALRFYWHRTPTQHRLGCKHNDNPVVWANWRADDRTLPDFDTIQIGHHSGGSQLNGFLSDFVVDLEPSEDKEEAYLGGGFVQPGLYAPLKSNLRVYLPREEIATDKYIVSNPHFETLTHLDPSLVIDPTTTEDWDTGEYTLALSYPLSAPDAEALVGGNVILKQDQDGKWQPFVIRQPETAMGDSMVQVVQADHLYYELGQGQPKTYRFTNAVPSTAIGEAITGTRWQIGQIDPALIGQTADLFGELMNPLERLRQIESTYEGRLCFRCIISGREVVGLFVDFLEVDNEFRGQRFEFGHNLRAVTIATDYSQVKTALVGTAIGEEVDIVTGDPMPMTFKGVEWKTANGNPADKPLGQDWVGDEGARELYGIPDGQGHMQHRFGVHESEATTEPGLLQGTWIVLQRQNRPQVTVQATVADLEQANIVEIETGWTTKLAHEKIRLGNICYVLAKHKGIKAALDLRIIRITRPLKDPGATEVEMGDPIPLQSHRLAEMERWQKWADRRRRGFDRGKGPATVVIASEDTSNNPWYAHIIVPTGAENFQDYFAQAVDMLPEKGGQIVIQEGEYVYSGDMVINRDSIRISGQGDGTILHLIDDYKTEAHGGVMDYNCNGIMVYNCSGVQIADLAIDGNRSNQTQGVHRGVVLQTLIGPVTNFSLQNVTATNLRGPGITCVSGTTEGQIDGCTIKACQYGIALDGSSEVIATNCTCSDNDVAGIQVTNSSDITIEANNCRRNEDYGIYLAQCQKCSISSNKCMHSGGQGENLTGIYLTKTNNCIIQGNTSSGNAWTGILIYEECNNNIVSGNTCNDNQQGDGLMVGFEAKNNTVTGNACSGNGRYGIYLLLASRNIINTNTVTDNGSDGIRLAALADNNNVQNNSCTGNSGCGIAVNGADGNIITNNDLRDNGTDGLQDEGAGTLLDAGNHEASGGIPSHGSNANGNWIRWSNGTQCCWQEVKLDYASASSLNARWTYPQSFLSGTEPSVQLALVAPLLRGNIPNTYYLNAIFIRNNSNTYCQPQAQSALNYDWASGHYIYVKCYAVGQWK